MFSLVSVLLSRVCRVLEFYGLVFVALTLAQGCSTAQPEVAPTGTEGDVQAKVREAKIREILRIPEFNPVSGEKLKLGRFLFYDRRLSENQQQSCSDCHKQELAFSDGKVRSKGSTGHALTRNSMGLANVAYLSTLTRAANNLQDLESQVLILLRNDNPVGLRITDAFREIVLERLSKDRVYQQRFKSAFASSDGRITIRRIAFALASFCRARLSFNSPYDRYLAGDKNALTPEQKKGLGLFQGERFECIHCHTGVQQTAYYHDARP